MKINNIPQNGWSNASRSIKAKNPQLFKSIMTYPIGTSFNEKCYCIIHDIKELPLCRISNNTSTSGINILEQYYGRTILPGK